MSCRNAGLQVVHHPYVKRVRDYLISHGPMFDVVVLSRCDFAHKHIADVRLHAPQSRIIFDTVDLHYLREQREAQVTQDPDMRQKAQEKQLVEDSLIKEADETWVVSPIEQQMLQENWPNKSIQLVSTLLTSLGQSRRLHFGGTGFSSAAFSTGLTSMRCFFRGGDLSARL